jgi:hypothetical protein
MCATPCAVRWIVATRPAADGAGAALGATAVPLVFVGPVPAQAVRAAARSAARLCLPMVVSSGGCAGGLGAGRRFRAAHCRSGPALPHCRSMDAPLHAPLPATAPAPPAAGGEPVVRQYRHVLLWPLQLVGEAGAAPHPRPWERLEPSGPWREVVDEYTGSPDGFHERHYNEFVTFLPYVQRFLYGGGRSSRTAAGGDAGQRARAGSPMRVFRRSDVACVRAVTAAGAPPLELAVEHIDLYFFHDLDVVLLNVELYASDLPLAQAQELMYRLGRAYPGGWTPDGAAQHCLHRCEWLDTQGRVLAASDVGERERFLEHVAEHRAPRIAAHWAWLLQPLRALHDERGEGEAALRFRQIEYYRMPMMAWLALDDPRALARADFVRLGLVTGSSGAGDGALPFSDAHLADFERRHCYDRFWSGGGAAPDTRYLGCGHSLVVVGRAGSGFYGCRERGVLAQFRHQHFLLFLIAHVQKAALMMYSARLVDALERLDVADADSVREFKRRIRRAFEGFLRFTHRYWFHDVSEQAQARALFHLTADHLGLDALYAEVKERIADMNAYLDADSLRRQANTVVRLTVVTIFGLIGTVTTGFLGMNLFAAADEPTVLRVLSLGTVLLATIALTAYTIVKSKRLSDFLDALSDERLTLGQKAASLAAVWRAPRS